MKTRLAALALLAMAFTYTIQGYAVSGQFEKITAVVNFAQTDALLVQLGVDAERELPGSLYRKSELVMADSKLEVPRRDGILGGTGHVDLPEVSGSEVLVRLGYNTPYALRQHEELTWKHKVGKARYLADPFARHVADLDEWVANDLKQRLGL